MPSIKPVRELLKAPLDSIYVRPFEGTSRNRALVVQYISIARFEGASKINEML